MDPTDQQTIAKMLDLPSLYPFQHGIPTLHSCSTTYSQQRVSRPFKRCWSSSTSTKNERYDTVLKANNFFLVFIFLDAVVDGNVAHSLDSA